MSLDDFSGYFLYHSIGQYPSGKEEIINAGIRYLDAWTNSGTAQWDYALNAQNTFIQCWQQLLNAPSGTIAPAPNVTNALYKALSGLPRDIFKGKKILIAEDCFPSIHFMLMGLQTELGCHIVTIKKSTHHWVTENDFAKEWDNNVVLALVTWVSSVSAAKMNIAPLSQLAKEHGSLLAVDITQGVGLIPFDINELNPDIVIGSSLKWLCGVSGAAILYMRKQLIPQCQPVLRGWFSQTNPFSWDLDKFEFAADANRFGDGTPSCLPLSTSVPGLAWILSQEPYSLLNHTQRIQEHIIRVFDDIDWQVMSPRETNNRGGTVLIKPPETLDIGTLLQRLELVNVYIDSRKGLLRFSPGIMSTIEGVNRMENEIRYLLNSN